MIGAFVRETVSGALVFATAWFWLSVNFDRAVLLLFLLGENLTNSVLM